MRIVALMTAVGFAGCLSSGSPPTSTVSASTGTAKVGQVVQLDGGKSVDKNKNGLTYEWRFVSAPDGSSPAFSDATSANPTFTPDAEGSYVVGLVVKSGAAASASAQTTITVSGSCFTIAPTQTANQGEHAQLVAVASDPGCGSAQGEFKWGISQRPAGSAATASGVSLDPNFAPDLAGAYTLSYAVKYGGGSFSATKSIAVTVTSCEATIQTTTPLVSSGGNALLQLSAPACNHLVAEAEWHIVSTPSAPQTTLNTGGYTVTRSEVASVQLNYPNSGQIVIAVSVTDDHELKYTLTKTITFTPPLTEYNAQGFSTAFNNGFPSLAYADTAENVIVFAEYDPTANEWKRNYVTPGSIDPTAHKVSSPALAFMSGSVPCIAYADIIAPASLHLVCRMANGAWPGQTGASLVGTIAGAQPNASAPGISLVANQAGTKLHMLYADATAGTGGLFYESSCTPCTTNACNPVASCPTTPNAVIGGTAPPSSVGKLILSAKDAPRIAFVNVSATIPNSLFAAVCPTETETCVPTTTYAVSDSIGANPNLYATGGYDFSIAVSPTDANTYFAFVDLAQYARFRSCPLATCSATTNPIEFASNGEQAFSVDMVVAQDGTPNVWFYDRSTWYYTLKQAIRSTGGWASVGYGNNVSVNAPGMISMIQPAPGTTIGVLIANQGNINALSLFDLSPPR